MYQQLNSARIFYFMQIDAEGNVDVVFEKIAAFLDSKMSAC
jgi:hypothetical protein